MILHPLTVISVRLNVLIAAPSRIASFMCCQTHLTKLNALRRGEGVERCAESVGALREWILFFLTHS